MTASCLWKSVGLVCLVTCVGLQAQQQAPSNTAPDLSGTGKTDFIPIWTNSTTLGSSTIFEKSNKVGIGTTAPAATLEVNGTAKFDQAVTFASGQIFPGTATLGQNTFTAVQTISSGDLSISSGNLDLPQTTDATTGVINMGGSAFIHACCSANALDTFVGAGAGNMSGQGGLNTALGGQALHADSTGGFNTAIGGYALYMNTEGSNNTAVGYYAEGSSTTGNDNAGLGLAVLSTNAGDQNTAIGDYALTVNTTGNLNSASGYQALVRNTSGHENTAVGGGTLNANTTGYYNTAIGRGALTVNTTGALNTAVGFLANVGSTNLTNATVIGAEAVVSASNALVLGSSLAYNGMANTNVGIDVTSPSNIFTILQGGGQAIADGWSTYSSRRWKSNIQPLHGALGRVERLQGVEYTYTANGKHDIGMIAEEVGKVVPEVVSYEDNGKDARGIDYARLTALLVEAVKQQETEIRQEQAQISRLKSEVQALQDKANGGSKAGR